MSNIHKNFNSRTREGATKKQLGGRIGLLVSIHAPVWVRLYDVYIVIGLLEFQFTHPCGCDGKCPASSYYLFSFNSRTRVGATHAIPFPWVGLCVSIHAPVWVRLHGCSGTTRRPHVSIHAPVWVRPTGSTGSNCSTWFQFTHPCGCDLVRHPIATMQRVSIHAPVWVRHPIAAPIGFFVKFQFTHPCGCDFVFFWILLVSFGFNSRTRVGATA